MRLSSCSRVTGNCSITSSMLKPASRFSNKTFTGVRVPLSTHAPLTFPGMLSTAGHCDQSRLMIRAPSLILVRFQDETNDPGPSGQTSQRLGICRHPREASFKLTDDCLH